VQRLARVEQLGDAEIQQLGHALRGDQDVVGLQVAVHDQVLMGVMHGGTDGADQLDALGERQAAAIAINVDGLAVDIFHHQIGRAVGGAAAVQQPCDVRVLQRRQDLPFHPQPALHLG
jgi:hypothetical protein